ncbi:MAG: hypothetical protein ABWY06_21950 [Pseudomonas sp.]|uniref:hypothetical protein n=1 Tax=Pseudomonas sp. TaxID=306 RepID=UPI003391E7FB
MQQLNANTIEELQNLIAQFGDEVLFRGQNSRYGEIDRPSIVTSFDRQGCIPSEMLKWSRYAKNVLRVFLEGHMDDLGFQQALLQHYGWRSFYIDCSSNPAVGAWFASHKYLDNITVEISEDCEEQPVMLRKRAARYEFEEGNGYIYVLDKTIAAEVGLVDLAALTIEGSRPRTTAQAAWLLGPLRNKPVPHGCFLAQISANRAILRDFAASHGLTDTNSLFPPVAEDPILKALLGLPWSEIPSAQGSRISIPAFKRALELPEYHPSFVKIAWPNTAFFRGEKISETLIPVDGLTNGGISINVPEIVLFGSANIDTPMNFPHVEALVNEHNAVLFEIDALIQHVNMGHLALYQKGICVMARGPDLYELCELLVEHPGQKTTRAGVNHGIYYRKQPNGLWIREPNEQECSCGNSAVHDMHISALHIAECYIANPEDFED